MRTSSRFQPFAPSSLRTSSLRRLKTAFSPSSSISSARSFALNSGASTPHRGTSSSSSTGTASPLSSHMGSPAMASDCETMEGLVVLPAPSYGSPVCGTMDEVVMADFSKQSVVETRVPLSPRNKMRSLLMWRRKQQSSWDLRIEEEQRTFGTTLRVFEPRPKGELAMFSIFEVLENKW